MECVRQTFQHNLTIMEAAVCVVLTFGEVQPRISRCRYCLCRVFVVTLFNLFTIVILPVYVVHHAAVPAERRYHVIMGTYAGSRASIAVLAATGRSRSLCRRRQSLPAAVTQAVTQTRTRPPQSKRTAAHAHTHARAQTHTTLQIHRALSQKSSISVHLKSNERLLLVTKSDPHFSNDLTFRFLYFAFLTPLFCQMYIHVFGPMKVLLYYYDNGSIMTRMLRPETRHSGCALPL